MEAGERMMADIRRLCAFGPRPSGSNASALQFRFLHDHFRESGATVWTPNFFIPHPSTGEDVHCCNLIASFGGDSIPRKLLGAHGDTRPFPDRERDPARRLLPFVGANDGASGVAVLMEVARMLAAIDSPPVDLVVFDAEELIIDGEGEYCLGAHELAAWPADPLQPTYSGGVVVDMVGRKGSTFLRERHGEHYAKALNDQVWSNARRLGATCFQDRVGRAIIDDHCPLLGAGIPAVVLIDLEDPRWHTADDVPEHCSAETLEQVYNVVVEWLLSS